MISHKLIGIDYPVSISFATSESLPDFKSSACEVRNNILRRFLKKIDTNVTDIDDYYVKEIFKNKSGEFWLVGN